GGRGQLEAPFGDRGEGVLRAGGSRHLPRRFLQQRQGVRRSPGGRVNTAKIEQDAQQVRVVGRQLKPELLRGVFQERYRLVGLARLSIGPTQVVHGGQRVAVIEPEEFLAFLHHLFQQRHRLVK